MKKTILILLTLIVASVGNAAPIKYVTRAAVDSVYICQSKSAYAYHKYECRGLARCTHGIVKITRAQAIKLGYRACKICYQEKLY
ncbi:MAG TPA: hypothetical protein VK671_04595 [Mucilaginibacter sp.]|nr:hypothetical protein [Mucilaginibacter sp.]